jgi:hypothetical protein
MAKPKEENSEDLICVQSNCIANENGYCTILNDTYFKYGCNFFKVKATDVNLGKRVKVR